MGNQKTQNFMMISNLFMPLKKLEPKNYANFEYFRFCGFFHGFLLLTFVKGISESPHQQI
jgi:hypothetical protein